MYESQAHSAPARRIPILRWRTLYGVAGWHIAWVKSRPSNVQSIIVSSASEQHPIQSSLFSLTRNRWIKRNKHTIHKSKKNAACWSWFLHFQYVWLHRAGTSTYLKFYIDCLRNYRATGTQNSTYSYTFLHDVLLKKHPFSFFHDSHKWWSICTKFLPDVAEESLIQNISTKCGCYLNILC